MPRSWRRLASVLESSGEGEVQMSFDEVSVLVGDVSKSELRKRSFWSNSADKPQARAWLQAGYRVEDVDIEGETVTFRRV
jgi:hypothetical protein